MTMRVFGSLAAALALTLPLALPAAADIVERQANIQYDGIGKWSFDDGLSVKSILVGDKAVAKLMAKVLSKGGGNVCDITYESDSKIAALNGDFYYVIKISKCL